MLLTIPLLPLTVTNVTCIMTFRYNRNTSYAMPINIDFEWTLDTKGYRLDGGKIIGNGGPKQHNRFKDFPKLYLIFAKIEQTPKGLLDFVNKFGRLTLDELDKHGKPVIGEDVRAVLGNAKTISMALEMFSGHIGNPPKWPPGQPFKYDLPSIGARVQGGIPIRGQLSAWLVPDPITGVWQLQLRPPTLLDAIWLQFAQAITSNAELRTCGHCGKWFEAGQGSDRRAGAKFCSDECRVEFNSLQRSR